MWKFFFYPQWRYDLLENYLNDMEAKGYRLTYVSSHYFFKFTAAIPKRVSYLYSYTFIKEIGMIEQDHLLRKQWNAQTIDSSFFLSTTIHRITDTNANCTDFINFREKYLLHVLIQKIIFVLLIGIGVLGISFSPACSVVSKWFYVVTWLILLFYYLVGVIHMVHKRRR